MRSILLRFTLLGIAGLLAACSGNSSSLPSASGPAVSGPTKLTAPKTFNLPASFHLQKMTSAEVAAAEKALGVHNRPTGQSSSSGIPGGFGFTTLTSFSGIQETMTAYNKAQFTLNIPTDPTFGTNTAPSTDLFAPIAAPAGGGCTLPYVRYSSYATTPTSAQTHNNTIGWLDECARPRTGYYNTVENWSLIPFVIVKPGTTAGPPPTISFSEANFGGTWYLQIYCYAGCGTPGYYYFLLGGTPLPGMVETGTTDIDAGAGFTGWVETSLAPGACQTLPAAGLGAFNIATYPPGSSTSVPLSPANSAVTAVDTRHQTCFTNDGSLLGSVYTVNNGGSTPFYNALGGQFLVTSTP